MIYINKLIILSKIDEETIMAINNMIRDQYGNISFSIITKIPKNITNFNNDYGKRFDNIICEISIAKRKNLGDEEIEEIKNECETFMTNEEIKWCLDAVDLNLKYGAYTEEDYYYNNVGVHHDFLYYDDRLPSNNKKQFSFYTEDGIAENWAKRISEIFDDIVFEYQYKEKSLLKYKKKTFKSGNYISN